MCSTLAFSHGRTEAALVAELLRDEASPRLPELLAAAVRSHREVVRDCQRGHGHERHLLALYALSASSGAPTPALFLHQAWSEVSASTISTSGARQPSVASFSFGPVCPTGIGVGYLLFASSVECTVSSWKGKGPPAAQAGAAPLRETPCAIDMMAQNPPSCNASAIADNFFQNLRQTHCPRSAWVKLMRDADSRPAKTVVVVGCNKGYDAAAMTSPAMAAERQTADFPAIAHAGREDVGIDYNTRAPDRRAKRPADAPVAVVSVRLRTVDSLVESERLALGGSVIDILTTDAEGHDALVLEGARDVLTRVRYLEFEYHAIGHWASASLRDVIGSLESSGMDCYWAGHERLWRLTGCWDDRYQHFRAWSNIACVRRGDVWHSVLGGFAFG
uniref:Uncharacterized protein n=1 Tax=Emiliania huxleyi (strain CCMP1516) TaxID=280463 RepID=A0A0D3KJR3_EMIH1